MHTFNIRNTSLSLCLGMFTFYLYIVGSHNSTFEMSSGARDIASTDFTCRDKTPDSAGGVKIEVFVSKDHSVAGCEIALEINTEKINAQDGTAEFRMYMKHGRDLVAYPSEKEYSKVNVEFDENGRIIPTSVVENFIRVHEEDLKRRLVQLQKSSSPSTSLRPVARPTRADDSDDEETATAVATALTSESSDEQSTTGDVIDEVTSEEEIEIVSSSESNKDLLESIVEEFNKLDQDSCSFSNAKDLENLALIYDDITDGLNIRRTYRPSRLKRAAEKAETADLEDLLTDLEDFESEEASRKDRIECLSAKALKINDQQEQAAYFYNNIKPLMNQALLETNDLESFNKSLKSIGGLQNGQPSNFFRLDRANAEISLITDEIRLVGQEVMNCQKPQTECVSDLQKKSREIQKVLPDLADGSLAQKQAAFRIEAIEGWLNKAGATSAIIPTAENQGQDLDSILAGNGSSGSSTSTSEDDLDASEEIAKRAAQIQRNLRQSLLSSSLPVHQNHFSGRKRKSLSTSGSDDVRRRLTPNSPVTREDLKRAYEGRTSTVNNATH